MQCDCPWGILRLVTDLAVGEGKEIGAKEIESAAHAALFVLEGHTSHKQRRPGSHLCASCADVLDRLFME